MEEHCPNIGALMVCVCVYPYGIFTKIPITDRKCVKILLRMYSNQGGFRLSKENTVDRINIIVYQQALIRTFHTRFVTTQ